MVKEILSSKEARANWRSLLDKVLAGDADVLIERNGKPVAVMIPASDYEDIADELDDLRTARRAEKEYLAWKNNPALGRPYAEIREELIEDGLLDEDDMDAGTDEAA